MGNGGCMLGMTVVVVGAGAILALSNRGTHRGHGSNGTAAIATLRNLTYCQAQFQAAHLADLDGDGIGEFGTLGEMTTAAGIRADAAATTRGAPVNPALLSPALAAVDENGIVTKSGHAFRIFLPGPKGKAIHEGMAAPAAPFSGPLDPDAAETTWCAYAWPVSAGNSGQRVFFVDQGGDVWQTSNADSRYSGFLAAPEWDAAMPAGGKGWAPTPQGTEHRGRDGNLWKRTN